MYKYTFQKNEKDSKAEKTVNNRDKSDFSISNSICQKTHDRKNPWANHEWAFQLFDWWKSEKRTKCIW